MKKVVKHHDGPDQGQKKARHRGLESFTMPHKFGRTGRVRHRKQGAYLLKQTEQVIVCTLQTMHDSDLVI